MGTGSLPGVKRPGRGVDYPPPSKCRVQERVGLYFYSLSGPSWPVTGAPLPLPICNYMFRPTSGHPQVQSFYLKHIEEEIYIM